MLCSHNYYRALHDVIACGFNVTRLDDSSISVLYRLYKQSTKPQIVLVAHDRVNTRW